MKRAIPYLLLFLFTAGQAEGLVRLCAEWLCPEGRQSGCCHQSLQANSAPSAGSKAGHCSPARTATPLELDRARCCESPSRGTEGLFLTAERLPKEAFRQLLLCSAHSSGRLHSSLGSFSADDLPSQSLQDPSPSDLHSPVLRI